MKNNYLAILPYRDVAFYWVNLYHDLNLSGLCIFEGEYCRFETLEGEYNPEIEAFDPSFCKIYTLTKKEKFQWLKNKFLFERCVGYHFTYPFKKGGWNFYTRKPHWFYTFLFHAYFYKSSNWYKKIFKPIQPSYVPKPVYATIGMDGLPTTTDGKETLPRYVEEIINKDYYPNRFTGEWPVDPETGQRLQEWKVL